MIPEGLLYPLILAAISGAAFIAYNHPSGFRIIGGIILLFGFVSAAYLIGYQVGADNAVGVVRQSASRTKIIEEIGQSIVLRGTANFYLMCICIYDIILLSLPLYGFQAKKNEKA